MEKRDLISVSDLGHQELAELLYSATELKKGASNSSLSGKTMAMVFQKPSHRTRVSFDVAMYQLGGHALYLSPAEIGLGTRETVKTTARVLSRYVDLIVARISSHEDLQEIAKYSRVPVINGLSDREHPCQALSDLFTIQERKGDLRGCRVAYIGDGNNVAASLLLACATMGAHFFMSSPTEYQVNPQIMARAKHWQKIVDLALS